MKEQLTPYETNTIRSNETKESEKKRKRNRKYKG